MELYENFDPDELVILSYTTKPTGNFGPHRIPQGIRAIHLPTGTVVTCETERSQHRNRHLALTELWQKVQGKPSYDELQAQVEQLRVALQFYANGNHLELLGKDWELNVTGDMPNWYFNGAVENGDELAEDGSIAKQALKSTPAQCLAEHDYNIAKNAFINGVNYAKKRPDVILHKVIEMVAGDYAYGEQLRQQAKAGEQ